MQIKEDLGRLQNLILTLTAEKNGLVKRKTQLEEDLSKIDYESLEKCGALLSKLSEKQRATACAKLQELCTYALQYSLSPNYELLIELDKYRGKPSAEVYIHKKDTGMKTSPIDGNGGGVVDIISMALRFVTMQTHHPVIDGPVILDEPYKMVSEDYIPMVSKFITNLCQDFDRQIILCTHNKFLTQDGRQIIVSMENGVSKVEIGGEL